MGGKRIIEKEREGEKRGRETEEERERKRETHLKPVVVSRVGSHIYSLGIKKPQDPYPPRLLWEAQQVVLTELEAGASVGGE